MVEIDGHDYVSLRADEVREGDTVHLGERLACWGAERRSEGHVELFVGTTADRPFELRPSVTTSSSNPVWVSSYDAQVTGRWTP